MKLRHRGCAHELSIAEHSEPLFQKIATTLELEPDSFELLLGFPPTKLLLGNGFVTAADFKVRNGDAIIVRCNQEVSGVVLEFQKNKRQRRSKTPKEESKQELAEKIANAFQEGPRDNVRVLLRKSAREEVLKQYEVRYANDRLHAAQTKEFEIFPADNGLVRVEYHPTSSNKSTRREDSVSILNEEQLRATVKYVLSVEDFESLINAKENLRPHKMAQVSPSTFWSLVIYSHGESGRDLEEGLRSLLPDLDWHFLDSRLRSKSEKSIQAELNSTLAKQKSNPPNKKSSIKKKPSFNAEKARKASSAKVFSVFENQRKIYNSVGGKKATCLDVAKLHFEDLRVLIGGSSITDKQLRDWHSELQKISAQELLEMVVRDDGMSTDLRSNLSFENVQDLARLRIPGRDLHCAKEMNVDISVVQAWQKEAQKLMEEHIWLRFYRSSHG